MESTASESSQGEQTAPSPISPSPQEQLPPYHHFQIMFVRTANGLAARYGSKIYLLGGALEDEFPHDYDVRIIMSESDWQRCFGRNNEKPCSPDGMVTGWSPVEWKKHYYELKHSRILSGIYNMNIDLKFVKTTELNSWTIDLEKCVRLDQAPDEFFKAGADG